MEKSKLYYIFLKPHSKRYPFCPQIPSMGALYISQARETGRARNSSTAGIWLEKVMIWDIVSVSES